MQKFFNAVVASFMILALWLFFSPNFAEGVFTAGRRVWDDPFEDTMPAAGDAIGEGDDHIRQLKEEIRQRAEVELDWGTQGGGSDHGRLREGAARANVSNAAPADATCIPIADDDGGRTCDDGRLWRDEDDGQFNIWIEGAGPGAWTQAIARFDDNFQLNTMTVDIVGATDFTDDGADSMTLHAHAARHAAGGGDTVSLGFTELESESPAAVATVDFDQFTNATYGRYLLTLHEVAPANDDVVLRLRVSVDGGATFLSGATDYRYVNEFFSNSADSGEDSTVHASASFCNVSVAPTQGGAAAGNAVGNAVGEHFSGDIYIDPGTDDNQNGKIWWKGVYEGADATEKTVDGSCFIMGGGGDIDGARLFFSAGNVADGEIRLYGLAL